MKQACLKRVLCYACCLSLVLGVFTYRPAKAEAVFVPPLAALGASLIASVVVGTTATFFVESGAADAIGTAIDSLLEEYIGTMDELMGCTPQEICEMVGSGATLEDGAIRLSSRAGELTVGFINWLREEKELLEGGDLVSLGGVGTGYFDYNGFVFPALPDWDSSAYPYCFIGRPYLADESYAFMASSDPLYIRGTDWIAAEFDDQIDLIWWTLNGANLSSSWSDPFSESYTSGGDRILTDSIGYSYYIWSNRTLISNTDSSIIRETYEPIPIYVDGTEFSMQPKPEFLEVPNEIPEGQILSIETGLAMLPQEDPQAIADAIMGAINAGTLSPSVSIEGQVTDIPGTGTDDDIVIAVPGADADLLDWTKYIGQKVASIPKAIGQSVAEAVAAAFSPDPKLVNEITGAFSAKFGFVETLKHVGDDMFGMTAASEPPVVWIHLEDAEGRYDYGGTVKALDMAWYQRYKADVDRILGGFLWLAYLWLLFKRLPDILSGAGMAAAESQYIDDHQLVSGQWIKVRRSKRL